MDFNSIVSTILPYASLAVRAGVCTVGVLLAGYGFYRKKGGTATITPKQVIAVFLFTAWLMLVVGLTLLDRGADYGGRINFWLFSGYVSAWNNQSFGEFQQIVFNLLMFMPLGFVLPLLGKPFQRAIPVLLVSFLLSLGVETAQLLTARGIFDMDDILHNTLGGLAGYSLFEAVLTGIRQKRLSVQLAYRKQEMRNRTVRPAIYDKST